MSDRRERIPAAEVPDPKLWKLPFWTEPKHLVHSEEIEVEEDDSDVLIEDEEIEIEPLTAEQLECIRQEAYNEGLEQGLVEGRQKGEKQGFESGKTEGLVEGKEVGQKLGYEDGYKSGEKEAIADGDNKSAELKSKIHSNLRNLEKAISEQTTSIESILPELVLAISQAVVSEELDQGSEHIVNIVQLALNALPTDSKGLTIECHPDDLPFFESSQEQTEFDGKFKANNSIQPGGCKVHSRYSSIDFTQGERWKAVIKQYQQQLKLGISDLANIQQEQGEKDKIIENEKAIEAESRLQAELAEETKDNFEEIETPSVLPETNEEPLNEKNSDHQPEGSEIEDLQETELKKEDVSIDSKQHEELSAQSLDAQESNVEQDNALLASSVDQYEALATPETLGEETKDDTSLDSASISDNGDTLNASDTSELKNNQAVDSEIEALDEPDDGFKSLNESMKGESTQVEELELPDSKADDIQVKDEIEDPALNPQSNDNELLDNESKETPDELSTDGAKKTLKSSGDLDE